MSNSQRGCSPGSGGLNLFLSRGGSTVLGSVRKWCSLAVLAQSGCQQCLFSWVCVAGLPWRPVSWQDTVAWQQHHKERQEVSRPSAFWEMECSSGSPVQRQTKVVFMRVKEGDLSQSPSVSPPSREISTPHFHLMGNSLCFNSFLCTQKKVNLVASFCQVIGSLFFLLWSIGTAEHGKGRGTLPPTPPSSSTFT